MKAFKIHTIQNTTNQAGRILKSIRDEIGFIPNVFAVIAGSTPALKAFVELNKQFSKSSFNAVERELIQLVSSVENQCQYCVAGHTAFAEMQHVPTAIIDDIRHSRMLADKKLEALRHFTQLLLQTRGMIAEQEIQAFIDAGYTSEQVLEVILGVVVKTFSNLSSNTLGIPLDDEFEQYIWEPDSNNETS